MNVLCSAFLDSFLTIFLADIAKVVISIVMPIQGFLIIEIFIVTEMAIGMDLLGMELNGIKIK
jgi:hypothetical protein